MPKKYVPGDFDLVVRRARAGLGLFANEAIPKGACIIEYTGKPLTREEYAASNSKYLFDIGPNKTIDGAPRWNTARYINHSCRPNCIPQISRGRVFIEAKRNIRPGEELSYDYGKEYFDAYIGDKCRCLKCMPEDAPARADATAKASGKTKAVTQAKSRKTRKAVSKPKASGKPRRLRMAA